MIEYSAEELAGLPHDRLLELLGASLLEHDLGFGPGDLSRARHAAVRWLAAHRSEVAHVVCGSETIRRLAELGEEPPVLLVAEMASLLANAAVAQTVSVMIVSALVARIGVESLCTERRGEP